MNNCIFCSAELIPSKRVVSRVVKIEHVGMNEKGEHTDIVEHTEDSEVRCFRHPKPVCEGFLSVSEDGETLS